MNLLNHLFELLAASVVTARRDGVSGRQVAEYCNPFIINRKPVSTGQHRSIRRGYWLALFQAAGI
jgi:hypothetical protein